MKSIAKLALLFLVPVNLFHCSFGIAQCSSAPLIDLGQDTTICSAHTLLLTAPSGFHSYSWSNGQTTPAITVSNPGTYSVDALYLEPNLVQNGDFESGNVNFSSAYSFCNTTGPWVLAEESQYAINSSPANVLAPFEPCTDHSPNGNLMMVVNGSEFPNTLVWSQTIPVSPNAEYIFSCWITNVLNSTEVSDLQFFINGVQLGPIFSTSATPCAWTEVYELWNSGSASTAVISILNQNTTAMGNDFALDDIVFTKVCHRQDEIVVQMENLTVDAGPDLTFCAESPQSLNAGSNQNSAQLLWNTGANQASIVPQSSGTYTVTATSTSIFQCQASDQVQVNIIPMDWNIETLSSEATSCGLENGSILVTTNGSFPGAANYSWTGPNDGEFLAINAPLATNLAPGWYSVTINSNGCTRSDSAYVESSSTSIDAKLTADVLKGLSPLEVHFGNDSQDAISYFWDFGDGNGFSTSIKDSSEHVFYHSGYYPVSLIAVGADHCMDTAWAYILVESEFILYAPNSFSPNGDPKNDVWQVFVDGIRSESYNLEIYNRWGELIWKSEQADEAWDGRYQNQAAPIGTYTWVLTCTTSLSNESIHKQGHLTIVR